MQFPMLTVNTGAKNLEVTIDNLSDPLQGVEPLAVFYGTVFPPWVLQWLSLRSDAPGSTHGGYFSTYILRLHTCSQSHVIADQLRVVL